MLQGTNQSLNGFGATVKAGREVPADDSSDGDDCGLNDDPF